MKIEGLLGSAVKDGFNESKDYHIKHYVPYIREPSAGVLCEVKYEHSSMAHGRLLTVSVGNSMDGEVFIGNDKDRCDLTFTFDESKHRHLVLSDCNFFESDKVMDDESKGALTQGVWFVAESVANGRWLDLDILYVKAIEPEEFTCTIVPPAPA